MVGSVSFAVTSLMVLLNSFDETYLGEDDSVLSRFRYRSTWLLMVVSGVFCTLGEGALAADLRVVHCGCPQGPWRSCARCTRSRR